MNSDSPKANAYIDAGRILDVTKAAVDIVDAAIAGVSAAVAPFDNINDPNVAIQLGIFYDKLLENSAP